MKWVGFRTPYPAVTPKAMKWVGLRTPLVAGSPALLRLCCGLRGRGFYQDPDAGIDIDDDLVPRPDLGAPAGLGFAIDEHQAVLDQHLGFAARAYYDRQLEQCGQRDELGRELYGRVDRAASGAPRGCARAPCIVSGRLLPLLRNPGRRGWPSETGCLLIPQVGPSWLAGGHLRTHVQRGEQGGRRAALASRLRLTCTS